MKAGLAKQPYFKRGQVGRKGGFSLQSRDKREQQGWNAVVGEENQMNVLSKRRPDVYTEASQTHLFVEVGKQEPFCLTHTPTPTPTPTR